MTSTAACCSIDGSCSSTGCTPQREMGAGAAIHLIGDCDIRANKLRDACCRAILSNVWRAVYVEGEARHVQVPCLTSVCRAEVACLGGQKVIKESICRTNRHFSHFRVTTSRENPACTLNVKFLPRWPANLIPEQFAFSQ